MKTMKARKRIVVRSERLRYYETYRIVGQVRERWRWKDVQFFGSFRAADRWLHGKEDQE